MLEIITPYIFRIFVFASVTTASIIAMYYDDRNK